jgi:phosphoribosylformylglycinamidine synthase
MASPAGAAEGPLVIVTPRLGTVSPWASKATDIAHNCGLARAPHRARRSNTACSWPPAGWRQGRWSRRSWPPRPLLHDRMTEAWWAACRSAHRLFTELPAQPMEHVDVLGGGRTALERPTAASAWRWPTTRSTTW